MDLVPYCISLHEELIKSWLQGHSLESKLAEQIPRIGFVVEDKHGPIAAGFLRKVEAGFALLDGLIANPESFGKRRYRAIDFVVEALIQEAKKAGFKQLLAMSKDKATLKRSIRHGFVPLPEKLIGMQL